MEANTFLEVYVLTLHVFIVVFLPSFHQNWLSLIMPKPFTVLAYLNPSNVFVCEICLNCFAFVWFHSFTRHLNLLTVLCSLFVDPITESPATSSAISSINMAIVLLSLFFLYRGINILLVSGHCSRTAHTFFRS